MVIRNFFYSVFSYYEKKNYKIGIQICEIQISNHYLKVIIISCNFFC